MQPKKNAQNLRFATKPEHDIDAVVDGLVQSDNGEGKNNATESMLAVPDNRPDEEEPAAATQLRMKMRE